MIFKECMLREGLLSASKIGAMVFLGGHAKFQNPTTCPSVVLVTVVRE